MDSICKLLVIYIELGFGQTISQSSEHSCHEHSKTIKRFIVEESSILIAVINAPLSREQP